MSWSHGGVEASDTPESEPQSEPILRMQVVSTQSHLKWDAEVELYPEGASVLPRKQPNTLTPDQNASPSALECLHLITQYPNRYLKTPQAAIYLGLSARYLEGLRCAGGGPPFIKLAPRKVVYDLLDLDAWADSYRRRNTAQEG